MPAEEKVLPVSFYSAPAERKCAPALKEEMPAEEKVLPVSFYPAPAERKCAPAFIHRITVKEGSECRKFMQQIVGLSNFDVFM